MFVFKRTFDVVARGGCSIIKGHKRGTCHHESCGEDSKYIGVGITD